MLLTTAAEDYLKAIFELQRDEGQASVTTSSLAARLGVARASVTGMLKKLAAGKPALIHYRRYRGVRLTPTGEKAALEVVRHHRLIESYLARELGYAWDEVHPEADRLEHVMSQALEDRMAAVLGDPQADPHGEPIPARDGTLPARPESRLSEMAVGRTAVISRVPDQDAALLRYLAQLGLRPNSRIEVRGQAPFDGPVHVHVAGGRATHALSRRVAERVFVTAGVSPSRRRGTHG